MMEGTLRLRACAWRFRLRSYNDSAIEEQLRSELRLLRRYLMIKRQAASGRIVKKMVSLWAWFEGVPLD